MALIIDNMFIQTKSQEKNTAEKKTEKITGKEIFNTIPRMQATLGTFTDFPSDWREVPSRINVGVSEIGGHRRKMKFRGARRG